MQDGYSSDEYDDESNSCIAAPPSTWDGEPWSGDEVALPDEVVATIAQFTVGTGRRGLTTLFALRQISSQWRRVCQSLDWQHLTHRHFPSVATLMPATAPTSQKFFFGLWHGLTRVDDRACRPLGFEPPDRCTASTLLLWQHALVKPRKGYRPIKLPPFSIRVAELLEGQETTVAVPADTRALAPPPASGGVRVAFVSAKVARSAPSAKAPGQPRETTRRGEAFDGGVTA